MNSWNPYRLATLLVAVVGLVFGLAITPVQAHPCDRDPGHKHCKGEPPPEDGGIELIRHDVKLIGNCVDSAVAPPVECLEANSDPIWDLTESVDSCSTLGPTVYTSLHPPPQGIVLPEVTSYLEDQLFGLGTSQLSTNANDSSKGQIFVGLKNTGSGPGGLNRDLALPWVDLGCGDPIGSNDKQVWIADIYFNFLNNGNDIEITDFTVTVRFRDFGTEKKWKSATSGKQYFPIGNRPRPTIRIEDLQSGFTIRIYNRIEFKEKRTLNPIGTMSLGELTLTERNLE